MSVISDQIIKEFRSERSINLLRVITTILFILTIIFTTSLLTAAAWDATALQTLGIGTLTIIGQVFTNFFRLFYIAYTGMIEGMYSLWGFGINIADAGPMIEIGVSADLFFNALYFGTFQIFVVGSILAFAYFVFNCEAKWAFLSFVMLHLAMVLAIITPMVGDMLSLIPATDMLVWISYFFIIPLIVFLIYSVKSIIKRSSKWVVYLFLFIVFLVIFNSLKGGTDFAAIGAILSGATNLINPAVENSFIGNPIAFFLSPILWIALVNILFLETSFQTAYMYEVYLPTSERENRLKLQMEELERLARIKQDELEKQKKELQDDTELQSTSIRRFFSSTAFDYMREMIDKRKDIGKKQEKRKKVKKKKGEEDEEEEPEILQLDKVNQLFAYIESRYAQDKMAKESLTAKAAAPEMRKLLIAALRGTLIRFTMLILLALLIMNTTHVMVAIGQPDIQFSIELLTKEIIMILLLPICFLFPSIGSIIKLVKKPKVFREVKKEEKKEKSEEEKNPKKRKKKLKIEKKA